jgi:hypothetical protein
MKLDLLQALDEHLPGARQMRHGNLFGVLAAAEPLGFAARGVARGIGRYLEARHPMHEIGEVAQDRMGIAARAMLRLDLLDRSRGIAPHHRLEQVDDARPVDDA